jgi:hypothetical protein
MEAIALPDFPVAGGCHCGAVRYALLARPLGVYACHCKDCQRFSGAGYTLSMPIRRADLRVTQGTPDGYHKTADSGRRQIMHGCPECGTRLWNEPLASPDIFVLKPGTLDDAAWAVPAGNIWTGKKLPWVVLEAGAVNFDGQPETRQPLYDAWDKLVEGSH